MHKKIPREESLLDLLFSVFSAAPNFKFGKKGFNPFVLETLIDHIFMPTPGVDAIPEQKIFITKIDHDSPPAKSNPKGPKVIKRV
jgi:hypothetical protein